MAKRFTDSNKFRDTWYRKLTPKHKCLWEYMVSECSLAGILEVDYDAMSFHIGEEITEHDLLPFESRLHFLSEEKVFICTFVKFQQKELKSSNPAHKNIILELEKHDIPVSLDISELQSPFKGALKGLQSPISKGKGNSKGNSNSNVVSREKNLFDEWYLLYPHKVGRAQAVKAFDKAIKKTTLDNLIAGLQQYIENKPNDIAWCNPATWLNGERWLDQPQHNTTKMETKNGLFTANDALNEALREIEGEGEADFILHTPVLLGNG